MRCRLIIIFLILAAICLGPWPAGADPYYSVALNNGINPVKSGSTPQIDEYQTVFGNPYPGYVLQLGASAGTVLKSYTHQQYTPPSNTYNAGVAAGPAHALFQLFDIIISGPASGPVPVTVNLSLNGTLAATTTNNSGAGYADAHAWVGINGGFSSSFDFSGEMEALSHSEGGVTTDSFAATGIFSSLTNFSGSASVTTPSFNLSVGSPLAMTLGLTTRTDWQYAISLYPVVASMDANADFFHSLSFATSGDVFNLPAGYTVNSVSGGIVNNRFVGAPVPLPSTLLLLGSGLVGLAGFRRKLTKRVKS